MMENDLCVSVCLYLHHNESTRRFAFVHQDMYMVTASCHDCLQVRFSRIHHTLLTSSKAICHKKKYGLNDWRHIVLGLSVCRSVHPSTNYNLACNF